MFGLPYNPTRREIAGFHLALATVVAAIWIAAAAIAPAARPSPGELVVAAAVFAGLMWTRAGDAGYRIWHRLCRGLVSFGGRYLLLVWYLFVVCPVGSLPGAARRRRPPAWQPKASLAPDTYPSLYDAANPFAPGAWWRVIRWAASTGNLWACSLVPLLMLLAFDDLERGDEVPRDIYTLF